MRAAATAAVLLLAGCTVPHVRPPGGAWHATTLGLCEDYPEETRTLAHARTDLAVAHAAGAQVLRIAFGWDAMEPERGKFDWSFWDEYVRAAADDYGIRLIPYLCYTPKWAASDAGENYWRSPPRDPADFARFVTAIVTRYKGRIHSWELWNEPDNQAYWLGTPAQFASLIRAGSAAVRAADPKAKIVLGGIAGELDFLSKLLVDEHVGPLVDVVNIHSYYETWHPNSIERLPGYIAGAAGLIHDTGGYQPLWMAEVGYSTVGGRRDVSSVYHARFADEHTDEAQAAALDRTVFITAATKQIDLVAWYRINDLAGGQEVIGDDNNRHLGVRHVDGSPKPALAAFTFLGRIFRLPYQVIDSTISADGAWTGTPVVRSFRLKDGRTIVAAWLARPEGGAEASPAPDSRRAHLRITVPDTVCRRVFGHDAQGRPLRAQRETWRQRGKAVELDWRLTGTEVQIAELVP